MKSIIYFLTAATGLSIFAISGKREQHKPAKKSTLDTLADRERRVRHLMNLMVIENNPEKQIQAMHLLQCIHSRSNQLLTKVWAIKYAKRVMDKVHLTRQVVAGPKCTVKWPT